MIVISTQENSHSIPQSYFCNDKSTFTEQLFKRLDSYNFSLLFDAEMNAMQLLVFVKENLFPCFKTIGTRNIKMGKMGSNKGAILLHLRTKLRDMIFAGCHLDSKNELKREQQFSTLLNEIRQIDAKDPYVTILGDFNARLSCDLAKIKSALQERGLWYSKDGLIPIQMQGNKTQSITSLYASMQEYDQFGKFVL